MRKRTSPAKYQKILDEATRAVTAFRSWDELLSEAKRGYVPTLTIGRRDPPRSVWATEMLITAMRAEKLPVYAKRW